MQTFLLFLNSLSSLVVVAALVVITFFRPLVVRLLTSLVDHELEKARELLKSDLRKAEEHAKVNLQANEQRIKDTAGVALSALSGRQMGLDARRLKAAEALWSRKGILDQAKSACEMMGSINFEAAAKTVNEEPKAREFFQTLLGATPYERWQKEFPPSLEVERPFLSPQVWALNTAYTAAITLPLTQLALLAHGIGKPQLIRQDRAPNLLEASLPERADFIDKHGVSSFHLLLDELELKLLSATEDMLAGREGDAASVEMAASIMRAAKGVSFDDALVEAVAQAEQNIPAGVLAEPPAAVNAAPPAR
jgi:hypothetical protein